MEMSGSDELLSECVVKLFGRDVAVFDCLEFVINKNSRSAAFHNPVQRRVVGRFRICSVQFLAAIGEALLGETSIYMMVHMDV